MQQQIAGWIHGMIVIGLLSLHIKALCPPPEITCSGVTNCYMIYAENNDWYYYYKEPNHSPKNIGGNPPASASKYVLMRLSTKMRSLSDVEHECEKAGANIAVINNNQEYEQLTDNIVEILHTGQNSNVYVKVQNLPKNGLSDTCGKITVEDGFYIFNDIDIVESQCNHDQNVNDIVCESTKAADVVCSEPTTTAPTVKRTTTASSPITASTNSAVKRTTTASSPTTASTNSATGVIQDLSKETTETETSTPSKENQSEQSEVPFSNTIIYILVPLLLVMCLIAIGIICFCCSRLRKKRISNDMSPSSAADDEVAKGDSNIYVDEVTLLGQASVSMNVASDTIEVHLDSMYASVNLQEPSMTQTDSNQNEGSHYKVPREQNVYDYMTYENSGHDENDSRLSQQRDVSTLHYAIPSQSAKDGNDCFYHERTSLSIQYDVPKPNTNERNSKVEGCENAENANIKHGRSALKPPPNKRVKSQNNINKSNSDVNKSRQKHVVPPNYDIPVSTKSRESDKKEHQSLNKQESVREVKADDDSAIHKVTNEQRYTKMDKHQKQKDNEPYYIPNDLNEYVNYSGASPDRSQDNLRNDVSQSSNEHYYVPRIQNEYESFDETKIIQKGTAKSDGHNLSSKEHYDVPRVPNEYESCDDMIESQKLIAKSDEHLKGSNKHYDVPRLPNEYESCDNNVSKECPQNLQISNALYEALGDDDNMSHKGNKTGKGIGKQKTGTTSKKTNVGGGYMPYKAEHDVKYQELDKSTIKIIKFRE